MCRQQSVPSPVLKFLFKWTLCPGANFGVFLCDTCALSLLFDDALGVAPQQSQEQWKAELVFSVFCVLQNKGAAVLWEPLCPQHRGRCGHCCVWAQQHSWGWDIPWEHTARSSQGCHWSAALAPAAAWQHRNSLWKLEGKRVKELPFHLTQICKEYLEKKGTSGMLLGGKTAVCFLSSHRVQPI